MRCEGAWPSGARARSLGPAISARWHGRAASCSDSDLTAVPFVPKTPRAGTS